ncbi:AbiJ-related protein [Winogradskyella arenosi]|uniref:ABC-type multidrug transport system ATPase subunit n=1 Tax=Winogradskyella arenosi TaxID=533325 RepID=A0A368ZJE0_9FLAO|nr:AAA family ATPase [Winogradskyella arenosi]RCW92418.1 ABC-type multidrug transport system ATPase subunit [Winogradskyella arenosi]
MNKLSKKIRLDILRMLLSEQDLFGEPQEDVNIINFLDEMFDLKSLPSEDDRFSNAYEDAFQHLVNNYDWEYEYVLTDRFNIIDDPDVFITFLNKIIHPNIRKKEDDITRYYLLINPYLEKENLNYSLESYNDEGLSVYEVKQTNSTSNVPSTIIENKIPFYVDNNPTGYYDYKNSHKRPLSFPCFVLVNNSGWNDFSNRSSYYLYFYSTISECKSIGPVKIIHQEVDNTPDILNESFTVLNENFCSLGQDYEYYEKLKSLFEKTYNSIFWALKDIAIYPDILEEFENHYYFRNSLIRNDEQEQLLREVKYRLYDYNLKNLYSFQYSFKPKFADEAVDVHFDFDANRAVPSRIFALIGKNGTGKTQLITSLPLDISKKKNEVFTPKTPLFSKVIAVSYSAFDSFDIPKKTADFNYVYCGLKDSKGELYSEKGLKLRFHSSWKKIATNQRFDKWLNLLPFFLDRELINELIVGGEDSLEEKVDIKGFNSVSKKLSSGQSILLYIITEIVANIRYASLVIYDEPETHLHPNAISQLINAIYSLTNEFQSYCILATHSPLIVRELLSHNVYIMEREEAVLSVRKPFSETFGENLTVITEDIFGNNSIPNQYKKILNRLVESGKSYDEIVSLIASDNIPLSLNTRIYLKSIIDEKS